MVKDFSWSPNDKGLSYVIFNNLFVTDISISRKLLPNFEKLFCFPKDFSAFRTSIQIIIKNSFSVNEKDFWKTNSFSEFGNDFQ